MPMLKPLLIAFGLLGSGCATVSSAPPPSPNAETNRPPAGFQGVYGRLVDSESPASIPVRHRIQVPTEGAPAMGASSPVVQIVVFSDFECPYCSRVMPPLHRLLAAYPDDIQIVFRHFPLSFHVNALPAACAANEARVQAGDEGFWRMHDRLFAHQGQLSHHDLIRHAAAIDLDAAAMGAALDAGVHEAAVEADQAIASSLGVTGTPATFVNGRPIRGAQAYEAYAALVGEELRFAEQWIRAGQPREGFIPALHR